MKSISKHFIANVFDLLLLENDIRGIHGVVPPKGLDMFGSGFYKILLDTIHDVFGIGNQNNELDRLNLAVVNGIKDSWKMVC